MYSDVLLNIMRFYCPLVHISHAVTVVIRFSYLPFVLCQFNSQRLPEYAAAVERIRNALHQCGYRYSMDL